MRRWLTRLTACLAFFLAVPAWALSPVMMFFASGSTRFSPRTEEILDYTVAFIRAADVREIEITGSTDRVGSDSANLDLSRRRAEAVRDALLARGMSPRIRVRIVAAGESQPLNQTEDGIADAENRYVVVLFVSLCTMPDHSRIPGGECDRPIQP